MLDPQPYIDKRNANLWEELNSSDLTITIKPSNESNYGCYCQNKNAIIYVLTDKPEPASFAHELLHVKFHKEKMFAGNCFKRMIVEHPALKDTITEKTIEVITNCMEHVKMLPQFLAMGYDNSEFISDFNKSKFDLADYIKLCIWYLLDKLPAMDRFIGLYSIMRADNNPSHKYHLYNRLLRLLDKDLYMIIEQFWDEWLQYDTEKKREIWEPDYGQIILDFVDALAEHVKQQS